MSRKNFIAGKGFSVEDNDGIVVSFLEANDGKNIDLKNITSVEQNHTYDLDNSKKKEMEDMNQKQFDLNEDN